MTPSAEPDRARPAGRPTSVGEGRSRLRESLRRLACAGSAERLRSRVPVEIVGSGGFTRAMLSAVRGSRWVPLHLHTREDLDPAAADFRAYVAGGAEIPLANLLAETEMVRRRTAVLVPPPLIGTRAFRPIIEVARSPAYVAAPLVVEGRTVGFVHADRVGQGADVDDTDRRLVRAFADEVAVLYQRFWWEERLTERSGRASAEMRSAAEQLSRLDRPSAAPLRTAPTPAPAVAPLDRRPRSPLTPREWEVLAHVADGATNRVVAHRLTLSEDTVKTHMRNVLRKLGVATRSAAVARYLEISRGAR
jgi:LuxR family transcriptional regulator, regulator of acetate metabolism